MICVLKSCGPRCTIVDFLKSCDSDARVCICIVWLVRSLVMCVSKYGGSYARLCVFQNLSVLSATRLHVSQCLLVLPLASVLLKSCDSDGVVWDCVLFKICWPWHSPLCDLTVVVGVVFVFRKVLGVNTRLCTF